MTEWSGTTGSNAFDLAACPPRGALSKCIEKAGERADRGTELHLFAQRLATDPGNRKAHEEAVSEQYRHTARGMNVDEALDGIKVLGCEVSFVLNVKDQTCRKIGENINRRYGEHTTLTKYDIPFTVDVLGWSEALNCPVEIDYKSGQSIGEVELHGQRRLSAAGLMMHFGADTTVSRVAYIWDNGTIKPDGHEFTVLDAWATCETLVEALDAWKAALELVESGGTPTVFPDREKQCKYCSSFNACPYWNNLLKGALDGVTRLGDLSDLSPTEKGRAYDYVKDVLKVASAADERLWEHASKEPIPIDDKWEYRLQTKKGRSYFDAAEARGVIVTLLGLLGKSEEEIAETLAKLNKQGKEIEEVKKRKRELPVLKLVG